MTWFSLLAFGLVSPNKSPCSLYRYFFILRSTEPIGLIFLVFWPSWVYLFLRHQKNSNPIAVLHQRVEFMNSTRSGSDKRQTLYKTRIQRYFPAKKEKLQICIEKLQSFCDFFLMKKLLICTAKQVEKFAQLLWLEVDFEIVNVKLHKMSKQCAKGFVKWKKHKVFYENGKSSNGMWKNGRRVARWRPAGIRSHLQMSA